MIHDQIQPPARYRDGVAAVEFALVCPLVLTVVLGAIDFGRIAYCHVAIVNAAGEGATYASMNNPLDPNWATAVKQRVIDEAPTLNPPIDSANIDVAIGDGVVQVTVEYDFEVIAPFFYIDKYTKIRVSSFCPQTP